MLHASIDHNCIAIKLPQALEASSKLGGSDLTPFLGLLEGGVEGELFGELEDYFYYAMLLSQGVDTMGRRQVSRSIPLEEIPNVMRAMGFYPSEREIVDMLNEVKFGEYVETGKYVDRIDLGMSQTCHVMSLSHTDIVI